MSSLANIYTVYFILYFRLCIFLINDQSINNSIECTGDCNVNTLLTCRV